MVLSISRRSIVKSQLALSIGAGYVRCLIFAGLWRHQFQSLGKYRGSFAYRSVESFPIKGNFRCPKEGGMEPVSAFEQK